MRFHANGPILPLELLEERDNGNVVFFCGAGVSRPTMPDFLGLAQLVVEELQPPSDAPSRVALARVAANTDFAPALDQVFSLLQREYSVGTIENVVSQLLQTPARANVEQHSVVLKLSCNAAGRSQIVTTNFDLLFERASRSLHTYKPPALPDLASRQPLDGLVYLHGRRAARSKGISQQGLILSSADFGRAYLADGWATRFVRELLRKYVIVLLGYSANDPPMRYLLEGLHSRDDDTSSRIFAFDQGSEGDVIERWKDRGVRPLAYPVSDHTHSALWDTLRAWTRRAGDPDAWRRSIVAMASQGPRDLEPYQRGQVADLTSTVAGAKIFADAGPAPPAEWLCVLDRSFRCAEPRARAGEEEEVDPLDHYGLDDDQPRNSKNSAGALLGNDVVALLPHDERTDHRKRLAGVFGGPADTLPPRLFHLARWFAKIMGQPAATWWAATHHALHPELLTQIEWRLERNDTELHERAYKIWTLLLQKFRDSPADGHDDHWYAFMPKLKREGWSRRVLREFELVTNPYLQAERPWFYTPIPPAGDWAELKLTDIAEWKVKFPALDGPLPVTTEKLPVVFRIARRGLERAAGLLSEIETRYWHTATLHPEPESGERYLNRADRYLHWVVELFDRLCVEHPDVARHEVEHWPKNDVFFFIKLKVYVWMKSPLFSGGEAAAGLLGLPPETFLEPYHRRELLHTLRARWNEFSVTDAGAIEGLIIAGSKRGESEEVADFEARTAGTAAMMLGWLEREDCLLTEATRAHLPMLRAADPDWQPSWDQSADHSHDGHGGLVRTEVDPAKIIATPISEIIKHAEQTTSRNYQEMVNYSPFIGLVQQRPARALAGLAYEARQGRYSVPFWRTAILEWRGDATQRLQHLFAGRLASLPTDVVAQLAHAIADWFEKHLLALFRHGHNQAALALWDRVIHQFCVAGPDATKSGIVVNGYGREQRKRSRRTLDHAFNGPVGKMAAALFKIVEDLKISPGMGMPTEVTSRLERLFKITGEGRDHAVSQTALRLRWLYRLDPDWVREKIIPLLDPGHAAAEPAWSGYLHDTHLPVPALFALLKPHFFGLFSSSSQWDWGDGAMGRLHEFLVLATNWNQKADYVTFAEARAALQETDDDGRIRAAAFLATIVKKQKCWRAFGKPFIQDAWPRETRYQTEGVSRQLATLAGDADDHFPDVVQTIMPILGPVQQLDMVIHRMKKDAGEGGVELAARFPEPSLALLDRLVPNEPRVVPYGLAPVLGLIAGAAAHLRQDHRWKRLNNIVHRR